ncbi:glycerophosphodiester phosphodiesterase family protein, partial [Staphylococcus aureus]
HTHHLKDLGFIVLPFTVNEKADLSRLNKSGVDGVFTTFADKYKEVIK